MSAEQLQIELGKAMLTLDQLKKSINDAKITLTRGECFLEDAEWNVLDLRARLRRAKKEESENENT